MLKEETSMKKQIMKLFGIAMVTFTVSFVSGLSFYAVSHQAPAPQQLQAEESITTEDTVAAAVIPQ